MIIILYHLIIESSCQWVLSNTTSFRLRTHRPLPKAIIKKGPNIVDKQMVYLEQKKNADCVVSLPHSKILSLNKLI